nr:ribonuclease H-like domain, reverse transcriptase, RNA-dependent DNA polymerase [Tanacetum cinerariifolium]
MDVESAFLYGKIEKEVYVYLDFPDRVYKVEKALYGLHQALRAWYETLSTYLLDSGFQREKIDKTLFIKRNKGDILLVQVYVDDIIFGSTKKELCIAFEKLVHEKFQMSSMRDLTLFLGLQVKQKKDGIFISQDKYVAEILKKFRYLKGQPKLGLWYLIDSPFDLVAYTNSDYARASLDMKSTTGGCQFLRGTLISWQCKKQTVAANSTTKAEYVAALNKAVYKELGDSLVRAATTASSLGAEQDSGNINKTQSKATPNESNSQGTNLGGGLGCQETMEDTTAQTRVESSGNEESLDEDASKQGRMIDAIDADEDITLFWSTAMTQTINGEVQLHAQVDGKEIVITESSV